MSITNRLAKLEEASGINEPCIGCDWRAQQLRLLTEALLAQGVTLHKPRQRDLETVRCNCGRTGTADRTFMSVADRRELNKHIAEGRTAAKRERAEWARLIGILERERDNARAYYGAALDAALAQTALPRWWNWLTEQIEEAEA